MAAQPCVCVSIHGDVKTTQGAEFPADGGNECPSDADSRAIAVNGSIASGQDGSHAIAVNRSHVVKSHTDRGRNVDAGTLVSERLKA